MCGCIGSELQPAVEQSGGPEVRIHFIVVRTV
jgi:hypothetical protein